MNAELAIFIKDLNELIEKKPELASLLAIWKPICTAFIQLQYLLDDKNRLALILTSRYLYEQSIQCLWLLKSNNLGELERRHTMILKRAIVSRVDYLNKKSELECIKSDLNTPELMKTLCYELTKYPERIEKEKQKNEKAKQDLTDNLKNKGISPGNEAPNLDKMAEEALPCATPEQNRSLHFNLYKILSIASHPAVPFSSSSESGDFFKDYEGGTATQVGKIMAVKFVEYASEFTNEFIRSNSK